MHVEWLAPATCPSADTLQSETLRLLGNPPPGALHHVASAHAVVTEPQTGTWHVSLTTVVDGVRGAREIDAASCSALADATALIVALAIDPSSASIAARSGPTGSTGAANLGPAPSSSSPAPPSSAQPAGPPTAPEPRARPREAAQPAAPHADRAAASDVASPARLSVGASVAGDVGSLPAVALGAAVGVEWRLVRTAPWHVRASASAWVPQDATAGAPGGAEGARLHLYAASLTGCYEPHVWSLEVGPCAGLEVALLTADGFGTSIPLSGQGSWLSPIAGLASSFGLTRAVALTWEIDGLVPLARPSYVVQEASGATLSVHRPSAIAGRMGIGLQGRFF